MPNIKIKGKINFWERMNDTVDLDLSEILVGKMSIEKAGDIIYKEVVDLLNGKLIKAEISLERTGFAIHRVGLSR